MRSTSSPIRNVVSPESSTRIFRIIWRTITSICLSFDRNTLQTDRPSVPHQRDTAAFPGTEMSRMLCGLTEPSMTARPPAPTPTHPSCTVTCLPFGIMYSRDSSPPLTTTTRMALVRRTELDNTVDLRHNCLLFRSARLEQLGNTRQTAGDIPWSWSFRAESLRENRPFDHCALLDTICAPAGSSTGPDCSSPESCRFCPCSSFSDRPRTHVARVVDDDLVGKAGCFRPLLP